MLDFVGNLFTAEEDPAVQRALDKESKATIEHYARNSTKAFFWQNISTLGFMTASLLAGSLITSAVAAGGFGAAVAASPWVAGVALGAGTLGFACSIVAKHINLKNDVNIEELYSKRTGECVAQSIHRAPLQVKLDSPAAAVSTPDHGKGVLSLTAPAANAPSSKIACHDHQCQPMMGGQEMAMAR